MRVLKNIADIIGKMKILDKTDNTIKPFNLWDSQKKYVKFLTENRKTVNCKKRQWGGSKITGAYAMGHCVILPHFMVLVLSKSEPDANEYLRNAKEFYYSLPEELKRINPLVKDNEKELQWANGSRMLSLPANRGEGFSADLVIVDEAARITNADSHISLDEVLSRVEPTLDKAEGQLILVSKANGYNLFQKYYALGKTKETELRSFFVSCWDDPTFTQFKRDEIVRIHGEDHANENYPRNDNEAFLMSGRGRFNKTILSKFYQNAKPPLYTGILEKINNKIISVENPNGWISIWEKPKIGESYIAGYDIAEGIEVIGKDTDYSAGIVLDSQLNQVAEIHCRFEPDVFAEEIVRLSSFYNTAFTGIERNKDGLGVLKAVQAKKFFNLYQQEEFNPDTHIRNRTLGWRTDAKTKPELIAYLDELIRNELIHLKSEKLINELITYVVRSNGKTGAQDSCHDDLVMACAISAWCAKFAPKRSKIPIENNDGTSWDNWKEVKSESLNFNSSILNLTSGY